MTPVVPADRLLARAVSRSRSVPGPVGLTARSSRSRNIRGPLRRRDRADASVRHHRALLASRLARWSHAVPHGGQAAAVDAALAIGDGVTSPRLAQLRTTSLCSGRTLERGSRPCWFADVIPGSRRVRLYGVVRCRLIDADGTPLGLDAAWTDYGDAPRSCSPSPDRSRSPQRFCVVTSVARAGFLDRAAALFDVTTTCSCERPQLDRPVFRAADTDRRGDHPPGGPRRTAEAGPAMAETRALRRRHARGVEVASSVALQPPSRPPSIDRLPIFARRRVAPIPAGLTCSPCGAAVGRSRDDRGMTEHDADGPSRWYPLRDVDSPAPLPHGRRRRLCRAGDGRRAGPTRPPRPARRDRPGPARIAARRPDPDP